MDDPLDVHAEDNGVWVRKGSLVSYVSVHNAVDMVNVLRHSKMGNHSHHYKIMCTYYCHVISSDFSLIINSVNGKFDGNFRASCDILNVVLTL